MDIFRETPEKSWAQGLSEAIKPITDMYLQQNLQLASQMKAQQLMQHLAEVQRRQEAARNAQFLMSQGKSQQEAINMANASPAYSAPFLKEFAQGPARSAEAEYTSSMLSQFFPGSAATQQQEPQQTNVNQQPAQGTGPTGSLSAQQQAPIGTAPTQSRTGAGITIDKDKLKNMPVEAQRSLVKLGFDIYSKEREFQQREREIAFKEKKEASGRDLAIHDRSQKYVDKIYENAEQAQKELKYYTTLIDLDKNGELISPEWAGFLEKWNESSWGKYLNLTGLLSTPDSELYKKTYSNLVNFIARNAGGGRLTEERLRIIRDSVASLMNTSEGRKKIFGQMVDILKSDIDKRDLVASLEEEYGGIRPLGFMRVAEKAWSAIEEEKLKKMAESLQKGLTEEDDTDLRSATVGLPAQQNATPETPATPATPIEQINPNIEPSQTGQQTAQQPVAAEQIAQAPKKGRALFGAAGIPLWEDEALLSKSAEDLGINPSTGEPYPLLNYDPNRSPQQAAKMLQRYADSYFTEWQKGAETIPGSKQLNYPILKAGQGVIGAVGSLERLLVGAAAVGSRAASAILKTPKIPFGSEMRAKGNPFILPTMEDFAREGVIKEPDRITGIIGDGLERITNAVVMNAALSGGAGLANKLAQSVLGRSSKVLSFLAQPSMEAAAKGAIGGTIGRSVPKLLGLSSKWQNAGDLLGTTLALFPGPRSQLQAIYKKFYPEAREVLSQAKVNMNPLHDVIAQSIDDLRGLTPKEAKPIVDMLENATSTLGTWETGDKLIQQDQALGQIMQMLPKRYQYIGHRLQNAIEGIFDTVAEYGKGANAEAVNKYRAARSAYSAVSSGTNFLGWVKDGLPKAAETALKDPLKAYFAFKTITTLGIPGAIAGVAASPAVHAYNAIKAMNRSPEAQRLYLGMYKAWLNQSPAMLRSLVGK